MIVAFASGLVTGVLYLLVGFLSLAAAADTWKWFDERLPVSLMGSAPVLALWPLFIIAALLGRFMRRGRLREAA